MLVIIVRECFISKQYLNLSTSLLKYIEAPTPLNEGDIIIRRLIEVLSVIENISVYEPLYEATLLNSWKVSCQNFLISAGLIPRSLLRSDKPTNSAIPRCLRRGYLLQRKSQKTLDSNESLRGMYEDHQPYVSLWYQPTDIALKPKHNLLLAQLFIANARCRRIEASGGHFESSRKTAFTFARSICKKKYSSTLGMLPESACSTQIYLSRLENIKDLPRVESFAVFIRYAHGLREGILRGGSDNHRRYPAKDPVVEHEEPDLQQPSVTYRNIPLPMHSPAKEKSIERSGLSLQEFYHRMELRETSYGDERPMDGRSSSEHILRAKSSQKHMAMNNQQLSSRWSLLSEFEASCVATEIIAMYRNARSYSQVYINIHHEEFEYSDYLLEMSALLTIMFWFSIPYKDAITAVGHNGTPRYPTEKVELIWAKTPYLLIKTISPTYKTRYNKYKCLEIASHLPLNSGINIEQVILDHYLNINNRRNLFVRPGNFYNFGLKDFLCKLNQKYGCRITLGRISSFMFDAIANQRGSDITYAMLITGRTSYIGMNPLYYTAVSNHVLTPVFQKTCKLIAKNTRLEIGHRKRNIPAKAKFRTKKSMYGARIRPEHIEVERLCSSLAESIKAAKSDGPIATHNAMTIYTSAFINFATGYRAVGDASFHLNEIDYETGFAVISDKDSVDEHHSRLIWIMDECIKQIQAYRANLHFVLEFAALKLPNVYKVLNHALLCMKEESTASIPGLFIIQQNKIVALSPSIYESYFPDSYPYPANAHRHFLRSNLLEMGCPSDALNAFMGHWELGQEPWSGFSTLAAMDYRDSISPLLTDLLTSCGWKAINPYE